MSKRIALVGDSSSHGGSLVTSNQDGKFKVGGIAVCANGCLFNCPTHGNNRVVTAITTKSKVNGKLIVTAGANVDCGAVIQCADRNVYVE